MPKRFKITKEMATDPLTGERTAILTTNKSGRKVWKRTQDWENDKERAEVVAARKRYHLAQLRRAIA